MPSLAAQLEDLLDADELPVLIARDHISPGRLRHKE